MTGFGAQSGHWALAAPDGNTLVDSTWFATRPHDAPAKTLRRSARELTPLIFRLKIHRGEQIASEPRGHKHARNGRSNCPRLILGLFRRNIPMAQAFFLLTGGWREPVCVNSLLFSVTAGNC
jgi:hypothetical protein